MKNYSTLALEYDTNNSSWEHVDKRTVRFGDTAVVITDLDQFINRIVTALSRQYGIDHCVLLADKITYYPLGITRNLPPMFAKEASYAWQKEFRILFCESIPNKENRFARPDKEGIFHADAQTIIPSLNPVHLDIGNICDIAYAIPVGYLIHGKWWHGQSFKFSTNCPHGLTRLERLALETRNELQNYTAPFVKPTMIIH